MRPARDSDFLDGCLTKPSRIMNEYKRLRAVPLRMAISKSGCYSPLHRFLFKESYEYEEQRESENELVERKIRRLKQALRTFKVQSTKRKRRIKDERHVHPTPNRHAWLPPNPYPRLYRPKKRFRGDKSQSTQPAPHEPKPLEASTLSNSQTIQPKLNDKQKQQEPVAEEEQQKPQHVQLPPAAVEEERPKVSENDTPQQKEPSKEAHKKIPEQDQDNYIQKDRKMYVVLHRRRHRPLSPYPRLNKSKSHITIADENQPIATTPLPCKGETTVPPKSPGRDENEGRESQEQSEPSRKPSKPSTAPLQASKKPFADANAMQPKASSDGKPKEAELKSQPAPKRVFQDKENGPTMQRTRPTTTLNQHKPTKIRTLIPLTRKQ